MHFFGVQPKQTFDAYRAQYCCGKYMSVPPDDAGIVWKRICTYRHNPLHHLVGAWLVFLRPTTVTKFRGRGVRYVGWGKCAIFDQNLRLCRKGYEVTDPSVWVSITLSDLERREGRGQFFFGGYPLITLLQSDAEWPKLIGMVGRHLRGEACFRGHSLMGALYPKLKKWDLLRASTQYAKLQPTLARLSDYKMWGKFLQVDHKCWRCS